MYQHDLHSDEPEQHDIVHDLLFEIGIDHCVAAVFHYDGLAYVAFDIGKSLG